MEQTIPAHIETSGEIMAFTDGFITVEVDGDGIATMRMKNQQNRFNKDSINNIHRVLDRIESNHDIKALITTGDGKYYSTGIDLAIFNDADFKDVFQEFNRIINRLVTFPILTMAAINGHAIAGGAMMALSHDLRVMRNDLGQYCMNEVHLRFPIPDYLLTMVRLKLPSGPVLHKVTILGKRFNGDDAAASGIADASCSESEVLDTAKSVVKSYLGRNGYDRSTLHQLKCDVYKEVQVAFDRISKL